MAEIVSPAEGVRELVSDGDVVALEGFTARTLEAA
jgi:acyl CoA:acetate/3-ketoacid CoA transferase alpha subunit